MLVKQLSGGEKVLNLRLKQIEKAIAHNPNCSGNILLPNRGFTRASDGKTELLCSLNNKMQRPHYWGHIFYKEEYYFVTILALDRWLNASSSNVLFDEFWYELAIEGNWYPIGGQVFAVATSFAAATEKLINMISNFSLKAATNTTNNCDWRVVQIYPFPDPFKNRISLQEWKKGEA